MTAKTRVALIAPAGMMRAALADYLERSGYDVYEGEQLSVPSAFAALVMVGGTDAPSETFVADVRSWIKLTKAQRVVVVTSHPTRLKELVAAHGDRLYVLPAPAFGWELVDTLRSVEPSRPGGA